MIAAIDEECICPNTGFVHELRLERDIDSARQSGRVPVHMTMDFK
jgi:hypothetical protein